MTQQEWLAGTDIGRMLRHAEIVGSHRKHRLFGMACCRTYPRYLRSWSAKRALNQAEACVAGKIQPGDLDRGYADRGGMAVAEWLVEPDGPTCSGNIVRDLREREGEKVVRRILPLLRDIFRFAPPAAMPQALLAWNDSTVRRIAEGIYQDRAFSRLPILADAFLDAGCDDEELLAHCRSAGPHVRGCWAVDLVLGKE